MRLSVLDDNSPQTQKQKIQVVRKILAAILLDHKVQRKQCVDEEEFAGITWGALEADGYLKLDLEVCQAKM
jgi:hypothetical protein